MLKTLRTFFRWSDRGPRGRRHRLSVHFLALVVVASVAYIALWYANRGRVEGEAGRYRAMYSPPPLETQMPAVAPSQPPSAAPAPSPMKGAAPPPTPTSAFLLVVAAIAVILGTRRTQAENLRLKRILRQYGLVLAASVLLCGWWWIRNQILYGDPLAHRVFVELFSINRATPELFLEYGISGAGYLMMLLWGTALSFWGVFGQAIVYMPPWFYLLGWLFSLAVLVGLVRSRWTATTIWSQAALSWLLVVVAAAFVLAFYLRFNMIFYQVQARYLFTAIGPFSCLFVAGWIGLWVRKAAGQAYDAEPLLAAKVLWWALLGGLARVALWHLRPTSVRLGLPFLSM